MPKDLYQTLGVSSQASDAEIKQAYRRLAKQHHPDSAQGRRSTGERFKEISAAFDVLKDPERRKLYDEFGEASLKSGFDPQQARAYKRWAEQAAGPSWGQAGADDAGASRRGGWSFGGFDASGLYDEIFGSDAGPMEPSLNAQHGLDIDLGLALQGGEVVVQLQVEETCSHCRGRGVLGRSTRSRCLHCGGQGRHLKTDQLTVKIPPKTPDGSRLKVRGRGRVGGANRRGDLILEIRIRPHPIYAREGKDLLVDLPVTVDEAILGAKIPLRTPDGRTLTVAVPPGSQSGQSLRLKGQGLGTGKKAGAIIAQIMIRVPRAGGQEGAELLRRAYRDEVHGPPRG